MDCTCVRKPPRLPQREATIGRLKEQAEKAAARCEGDWVLPKSEELGYFRLISGSYRLPSEQQKVPGLKGFPGGAGGKESACQCRRCKRLGFDSWVRKIPYGKQGMAIHSNILAGRSPLDGGAWRATVHGVAKSQTRLSNGSELKD